MHEYIIENALNEFDQKSAGEINLFLKKGINTNNEYVFLLYQSMHIEFVSDKSKKQRFKNIPNLIHRHFAVGSKAYNEIVSAFDKTASEEKCDIADLEFADFPEIQW